MRYMIIVKASPQSEAGVSSSEARFDGEEFAPGPSVEPFKQLAMGGA